jgi:hypothetical protein
MSAMSGLIEDWIQIGSTLQRQLKTLDANQASLSCSALRAFSDMQDGTRSDCSLADAISSSLAEVHILRSY